MFCEKCGKEIDENLELSEDCESIEKMAGKDGEDIETIAPSLTSELVEVSLPAEDTATGKTGKASKNAKISLFVGVGAYIISIIGSYFLFFINLFLQFFTIKDPYGYYRYISYISIGIQIFEGLRGLIVFVLAVISLIFGIKEIKRLKKEMIRIQA